MRRKISPCALRLCLFILSFFALNTSLALFAQTGASNSPGVPWVAIDELGRQVVAPETTAEPRPNKTIGLFYFLWLDPSEVIPADVKNRDERNPGPYDLTQIIEQVGSNPTQNDEKLGANGEMHFWGEPLFGYYDSRDPWVVRRHLNLIADAGVDVLIFDATNLYTYPEVYLPLCDLLLEMKLKGEAFPQVAFMTNTRADVCVQTLWNDFYSKEKYEPLFFQWRGKPLILADRKVVPKKLRDKFTFRRAYWPTEGTQNTRDAWHWIDGYPQRYSWSEDENEPEELNVSTSQNLARDADAAPVWMSQEIARGRSFVWGSDEQRNAPDEGLNFAQQWRRAYELDPPFVMITGWNEWIAGRWLVPYQGGSIYAFIDQFNYEYSRDIEPTRNFAIDAYYLQMVDGIRKYKGTPRLSEKAPIKTIDLNAELDQWNEVAPKLQDYVGETLRRDFDGCAGLRYRNNSGRNDFVCSKVAKDDRFVYFYVETREKIVPELPDNLCLALDVDDDLSTGWRGIDVLIGRRYQEAGTVAAEKYDAAPANQARQEAERIELEISKSSSDAREMKTKRARRQELLNDARRWRSGESVDGVRWSRDEKRLQIAVPIDVFARDSRGVVSFKWLDSVPLESPADLYDQGDVAPESSFLYRVEFE